MTMHICYIWMYMYMYIYIYVYLYIYIYVVSVCRRTKTNINDDMCGISAAVAGRGTRGGRRRSMGASLPFGGMQTLFRIGSKYAISEVSAKAIPIADV